MRGLLILVAAPALLTSAPVERATALHGPPTVSERLVRAAERHLGKPHVLGGRDARQGCRRHSQPVRCAAGVDCQALVFLAYEEVCGRPWSSFAVKPSRSAADFELGEPVPSLVGTLRRDVKPAHLRPGDVIYFLRAGHNLNRDRPMMVRGGVRYGTWHTGMLHSTVGGEAMVIHAKPAARVVIEPLAHIDYDALYVLRWPDPATCAAP